MDIATYGLNWPREKSRENPTTNRAIKFLSAASFFLLLKAETWVS